MSRPASSGAAATGGAPAGLSQGWRALAGWAAQAWGARPATGLVLLALPFAVLAAGVVSALLGKEVYKVFTREDGVAEVLQVLAYAGALGTSVLVGRRLWAGGRFVLATLYAGLTLGLFFLVGEELSWGQRIFGWNTPESLHAINKQGETNLHNIHGVGYAFKWLQLVVGAYGTLLPLALGLPALARFRKDLSLLVPHLALVPYFAPMFVWRLYRNLFEAPQAYYFAIAEFNEVVELVLALGFLMFLIHQLRRMTASGRELGSAARRTA